MGLSLVKFSLPHKSLYIDKVPVQKAHNIQSKNSMMISKFSLALIAAVTSPAFGQSTRGSKVFNYDFTNLEKETGHLKEKVKQLHNQINVNGENESEEQFESLIA